MASPTSAAKIASARATDRDNPGLAPGLIVHDDMDLRLKVADLLRKAGTQRRFDSATLTAFHALGVEDMRRYAALFFVLEFADASAGSDSLLTLSRLRGQLPRLPIFVIARSGDERCAVRALKSGATDYWPIHSISLPEIAHAMREVDAASRPVPASPTAAPKNTASSVKSIAPVPGYRLVKTLYESESRAVYLAEHRESPDLVALKMQRLSGVSSDDCKRFLRECKLLSQLNNRTIANVIDFGATDEVCYLALEYFPCGSLRDRLRNPISEAEAVSYGSQICEALRVMHTANIVHRDLKPSNLMLTQDNRLVMIDFGLARSSGAEFEITRPDTSLGSPYYVAPEQIEGQQPDARSDLYSLGIVLYEMLVGTVPFRGKSVADIVQAHLAAPVPRLPPSRRQYQDLIDRLLAKVPADRFASAKEALANLRSSADTSAFRSNAQ
ncbi:MAG TPA: protein kinase [Steroidobacteraceae bacterium]|jgi:serine/threonine-protein kinase PpkA|nr:protein kinase [Steroidobacteraceae bacterium]